MAEIHEQIAVVDWFNWQYPKYAQLLTASLNGAHLAGEELQRIIQVKQLKKQGMQPGEADLFLYLPRGHFHGMALEMKDQGKTFSAVTKSQRERIDLLNSFNYHATWAAGSDEAIEKIHWYMKQGKFKGVINV